MEKHHSLGFTYDLMDNFSAVGSLENITSNDSHAMRDNSSTHMAFENPFFDTYFSPARFGLETTFALLSAIINGLVLVALPKVRNNRHTVYHLLFSNLAVANVFACALSLLCNNTLVLFKEQLRRIFFENACCFFVYLTGAVFFSASFAIINSLTMLGFSTVQYFAICKPLHSPSIVRKSRVRCFIACCWICTLFVACVPFTVLYTITQYSNCTTSLMDKNIPVVTIGSNICVGITAFIYVIIVTLCLRIYAEIRQLRIRLSQFRYEQEIKPERKAFITTFILLSTLTLFFLPYTIMYMTSLNTEVDSGMNNNAVIYFMNFLPYFKFLSDPIIYGMRMREVYTECMYVAARCGLGKCSCLKHHHIPLATTSTTQVVHLNLHNFQSSACTDRESNNKHWRDN